MADQFSSRDQNEPIYKAGDFVDSRYEVVSLLGKGAMGEVYKVKDLNTNSIVALKLFSLATLHPNSLQRFESEFDFIKSFNSEAIIKSYEKGSAVGRPYFTMELVEGKTLWEIQKDGDECRPMPIDQLTRCLSKIACGLADAHAQNIVHRDIKPENIMITKTGEIKITDFGIGRSVDSSFRVTMTGELVGTAVYMSPEQIRGGDVTARSDIYSLGIMAYELATGKLPFAEGNFIAITNKHLTTPIPPMWKVSSSVPTWFEDFVQRCCEKTPERRYPSMLAVAEELALHLKKRTPLEYARYVLSEYFESRRRRRKFAEASAANTATDAPLDGTLLSRFIRARFRALYQSGIILRFGAVIIGAALHYGAIVKENRPPSEYTKKATTLEQQLLDTWFQTRGERAYPNNIFIIYIDEKSLQDTQSSEMTFRRDRFAALLEHLAPYQPKAIMLDYTFPGPSNEADDSRLEHALRLSKTYVGWNVVKVKSKETGGAQQQKVIEVRTQPRFVKAARGELLLARPFDDDAVMRRFKSKSPDLDKIPPMARLILESTVDTAQLPDDRAYLNYYGPSFTLPCGSYSDIMNGSSEFLQRNIHNNYIFVGQNVNIKHGKTDEPDAFLTPYPRKTPGVELHATAAGNILDGSWIRRLSLADEVGYAVVSGALLAFPIAYFGILNGLIFILFLTLALPGLSYLLFLNNFFLPIYNLVVILWGIFIVSTGTRLAYKLITTLRATGLLDSPRDRLNKLTR